MGSVKRAIQEIDDIYNIYSFGTQDLPKQTQEIIKKLTPAQIEKLDYYREMGIKIGLDTNTEFDPDHVLELANNHRSLFGLKPIVKNNMLIFDSPFAAMAKIPSLNASNAFYGQHDIAWLTFYAFFRFELGLIKETNEIANLLELSKYVGWFWMSSDTLVVTRKPKTLHLLDKRNGISVLHNPNGLALEYLDGTGVYAVNGFRVGKEYQFAITTPADQLDISEVLKIEDVEVRGEILASKVNLFNNLDKIGAQVVDCGYVDDISGEYTLYTFNIGSQTQYWLYGACPSSGKVFFEPVHPNCRTIRQALNFREGEDITDDYVPPTERT